MWGNKDLLIFYLILMLMVYFGYVLMKIKMGVLKIVYWDEFNLVCIGVVIVLFGGVKEIN